MLRNESVSTIGQPEFINLSQDAINPGISKCDIKVLYLGQNRNGSYITREVAEKMAETLPGTPIVGAYRKDIDDFGDHGEVVKIENGEVEISCSTVPYGFVAPDARAWFKNFNDIDEFGNSVERTYLMTSGYLWTGQYPEIERCITEGMGQSMELDPTTIDGHYEEDCSSGLEFFIINDAAFTKLCVLGDSVEPCFEGASVTESGVSAQFSNNGFVRSLFSMMEELKSVLSNDTKGGCNMSVNSSVAEEVVEEVQPVEDVEFSEAEQSAECGEPADEFKKDEPAQDESSSEDGSDEEDSSDDEPAADDEQPEDDKKPESKSSLRDDEEKKYELLSEEFSKLTDERDGLAARVAELEEENKSLREFKAERIDADKDAVINKYHMLSDEDKAEVIEHKGEYSLDEIESKLALIYVKKNVDFDTVDGHAESNDSNKPVSTFSLNIQSETVEDVDPMLAALRETSNLY